MALVLRQETYAGATTKGSELTYQEGDENLIHLDQKIEAVDATTHTQNTDTALATGTGNAVTAADIRAFLDEETVSLSTFNTRLTTNLLVKGRRYFITDLKLHVRAVGINSISAYGEYDVFVPINDGTIGTFAPAAAYAVDDKIMYDWLVYKSLTAHTSATLPPSDATNWVVVATSDATAYQLNTNSCTILWDKQTGIVQINKKIDANGNEHYQSNELFQEAQNNLDLQSSITVTGHGTGLRINNSLKKSIINIGRRCVGTIQGNDLNKTNITVSAADLTGTIDNNNLYNCILNLASNAGVSDQVVENNVASFATQKTLAIRAGAVVQGYVLSDESSTALDQLSSEDAIVSSELNLNFNGTNDIYGVFEIIGADTAMSLVNLASWPAGGFNKIIVKPAPGLVLSVSVIDEFSISTNGQLIGKDIGSFDMFGANGHYMVLERRSAGGFDVVWATLEMLT